MSATDAVVSFSGMYEGADTSWGAIKAYFPLFIPATWIVIQVSVLSVVLSWIFGLIAALGKISNRKIFVYPVEFYIWFVRGTPLLTQIFLIYFALPQCGIKLGPFVSGVLALGINGGAYVAEIIRGGLLSIPKGQSESGVALGMSYPQLMRRIILPQVIRVIIPPITNDAATTLKNTSLLSTITVMEITLQTAVVVNATFRPFEFYILASIIYLIMTSIVMIFMRYYEVKYSIAYRS